jgi:hypothetical protein
MPDDLSVTLGLCPLDDRAFVILDVRQKFCSPSCREIWEDVRKVPPPSPPRVITIVLKKCKFCEAPFLVKFGHQTFCQRDCQVLHGNKVGRYLREQSSGDAKRV